MGAYVIERHEEPNAVNEQGFEVWWDSTTLESKACVTPFVEMDHCTGKAVCQRWLLVCQSLSSCICVFSLMKAPIVKLTVFSVIRGIHFSLHMMNSSLSLGEEGF